MPERRILASLIQDNSLINECPLLPDDFTEQSHRQIFSAIQNMAIQRKPFDIVILSKHLEATTGELWFGLLGDILRDNPTSANFPVYVKMVREESVKNKAKSIGASLMDDGDVSEAIKKLMSIEGTEDKVCNMTGYLVQAMENMEKKADVITVGITDLDKRLGGLHKSDLVVIAGRPGMGKTAVAFNMANNCNVPVGVISAEQSGEQAAQRFIAINGSVSVHRMRTRTLVEDDWSKMTGAVTKMHNKDIFINDTPYMSLAEIQRQGRKWKHQNKIGVIFIDYLQKISGTKDNKRDEVSEVVIGLKNLARELDIPVVALAQVNREADKKMPYMEHLAESSVIEREADQVITLYRDSNTENILEFNVCKNRHGPLGVISTTWIPEYMQIKDYAEVWGGI